MIPTLLTPGPMTRDRVAVVNDAIEELTRLTWFTATYPILLDQTPAGWILSLDVTAMFSDPITVTGPVTFNNTTNFTATATFENNVVFTGPFNVTAVNGYTFNFGTSVSLNVSPPGVFQPPFINVFGAPTFTPGATAFQWVQTLSGFYFWNGTNWVLQGFTQTGWRIYRDSATNTFAPGVAGAIDFDAERYDDDDYHDDAVDTTRVTIPYTGRWSLGAYVQAVATDPDPLIAELYLLVNGVTIIDHDEGYDDGGDNKFWIEVGNTDWEFAADDYVEVFFKTRADAAGDVDILVAEFWGHRIK
jgi:hypothetical protein